MVRRLCFRGSAAVWLRTLLCLFCAPYLCPVFGITCQVILRWKRHAGNESCVDLGPCIDLARAYALRGPTLTAAPRCASSHRACHHAGHRVYAAIITLHLSIPGKPVLRFQKNKLSYRFCDELACLIAQQVDDYRHHKIPKYYGEKGYFNTIDFKWCTKRMSSFDDNKVKG